MSYDLYFYKRKNSDLTETQIVEYLTSNLVSISESNTQWFVEDQNTEVYFSLEQNEPKATEDSVELFEDFENTHFSFNINYLRPDFFGQFAFEFVDKFVKELDLFVLNPSAPINSDSPTKPNANELYENWSQLNSKYSEYFFVEHELEFFPLDKSNDFYEYNRNKAELQEKLDNNYFVPKLFLFKRKTDGQLITICTWSEYIPNVFPPADYFLLSKRYRKLFKTVEEHGLISSKTLHDRFGYLLDDFDFKNCKIIHPHNAEKAKELYNSTEIEYDLAGFAERIDISKVVNVKPNE